MMSVPQPNGSTPPIMIVGAGITGLRAALDLAEAGYDILLTDRSDTPGGFLLQLDKQFPTNHCGLCRLLPHIRPDEAAQGCLRQGLAHERITFLPRTRLIDVQGTPGRLTATLESVPLGIDPALCTACGRCEEACPADRPDAFNAGLSRGKSIHPASPYAPYGPRVIDWPACTRCGQCLAICPTGAVNLADQPVVRETSPLSRILLATGKPLYDPRVCDLYGLDQLPNVVTATAYERLISPLGPSGGLSPSGLPRRPSDGAEAARIAWIQCVGSRNATAGTEDCSSVCCMFAVKEAAMVRKAAPDMALATIFYMDMRTYGRDFQRYRDHAENELGVRFVRCRVHSIDPTDDPHQAAIHYIDWQGRLRTEFFDLVVLSTGQLPEQSAPLPPYAGHPGVMVADSARQWSDIAESIVAADTLAAEAMAALGPGGAIDNAPLQNGYLTTSPKNGPDVLALFVSPLDEDVDWNRLDEHLPPYLRLLRIRSPLGPAMFGPIRRHLAGHRPTRLVLITPASHPVLVSSRLSRETGLPVAAIETIRYAPIFQGESDPARRADILLGRVRMTAENLLARQPMPTRFVSLIHKLVVVGGGPAGMSAALAAARAGLDTTIVERDGRIGHTSARLISAPGRRKAAELAGQVRAHPGIAVRLNTKVGKCSGSAGNFSLELLSDDGRTESLDCGAVILATGGGPASTSAYGLGQHERIVTINQLAGRLEQPGPDIRLDEVVMILCAGCREEPRNYCSRSCCPAALETAMRIREIQPASRVTVFYRDIMTYGASERLYRAARSRGVSFVPFDPSEPPRVDLSSGRLLVEGFDPIMQEPLSISPDWLALAVGVAPESNAEIAAIFGIRTTGDGFIREADVKWRPYRYLAGRRVRLRIGPIPGQTERSRPGRPGRRRPGPEPAGRKHPDHVQPHGPGSAGPVRSLHALPAGLPLRCALHR